MANFTGEGNYTSKLNQTLSAPPAGINECFLPLNIFLSITAAVGNALFLVALKNVSCIHPPTKLFLRCLAVTDLCVGLTSQPLYATYVMSRIIKMNVNALFDVQANSEIQGYRHVVTSRRVCVVITCFCLLVSSLGLIRVRKIDIANNAAAFFLILCPVTLIFCYTRIHLKLRHRQAQLLPNNFPHGQQNGGGIPLNIARYKKTVTSIMWVQLALVASYVPRGIVAVLYVNRIEHEVALRTTESLVYSNSSLNPILYFWKIREKKQAVKDAIRQLYC